MFKLHRNRSDKLGERFEFKFSNFRALQVPNGWDKLFLSIVSVDTGRTLAKLNKTASRNGTCVWPDSITESVTVYQDDVSKGFEECPLKIVVSTGSSRTSILGEGILNVTEYLNSTDPSPIFLPLKKCNYGTVLQLKIRCLSTRSKLRDGKSSKDLSSPREEHDSNIDDIENKSDRSAGSSSSNHLGAAQPDESGNRETSLSASGSHRSSNSGDSSLDKTVFSPRNNLNSNLHIGRQDSAGSNMSNTSAGRGDDPCRSNNSSFSSRASGAFTNGLGQLSLGPSDSSQSLLETAEETIEELRDEAKMWERHSRKLKIDLEMLKKECSDKSKQQEELEMELSAAHAERDSLKQEIEQLKSSLEELKTEQTSTGIPKLQKELEGELKFQKESNANLTLQLNKSQEANAELVSILQELEETIEAQRSEISRLSDDPTERTRELSLKEQEIEALKEKLLLAVNSKETNNVVLNSADPDLERENETLKVKIQELERDCAELTDENLELIYKLKDVNKVTKEGNDSQVFNDSGSEIEMLASRIKQLEEELKHQEMLNREGIAEPSAVKENFKIEASDLEKKLQDCLQELEEQSLELSALKQKLEFATCNELEGSQSEINELKSNLILKEKEIDILRHSKMDLEDVISNIQKEKDQLEENLATSLKESSMTSKCLDEVKHDLAVLNGSIDSHVSTNKMLEREKAELEICKIELEIHISELEQENILLSERISGLEAQLRHLTNDKESDRVELEDSRSLILDLKDKIERQQAQMETQKLELKQKTQEAQKRSLDALEESEILKRSNSILEATVENLMEECSSLQAIKTEFKRQKSELHERVTHLEMELEESQKKNLDFCRKIELLEAKLSSLQKDFSSKEQSLLSQLESIFQEHRDHGERINRAHLMLKKMEAEQTVELENLERQIISLTAQVSSNDNSQEGTTLDSIREASILRSEKAKLDSSLKDANSQVKLYEAELEALHQESKNKTQGLVDLLNASKQSEEMLVNDIEHMQRLIESLKSSEEKSKKMSNELELKLKSSDYEKQQIVEEIDGLKTQTQKIPHLQDEISMLKNSLDEEKFEKGKLEEQMQSISEECEEMKTERVILMDKVSYMEKALDNGEDDRRSKVVLEAKLVRLESDLSAKEASCTHETELKNELSRMKRSNSEYQRRILCLEQEKDELIRKHQLIDKELRLKMQQKEDGTITGEADDALPNYMGGTPNNGEAGLQSLEANDMYKVQLISTENGSSDAEAVRTEGSNASIGGAGRTSQLEAELKEMKERYLHMSLQYAEVEASREELVLKLKSMTMKKEKRWFS